jgi:hypothetical protein
MRFLTDTYQKSGVLHHAYVIEGERGKVFSELCDFLERDVGIVRRGNPDFWQAEFDTLGIDESRALKEMQSRKAITGSKKIFVVMVDFITREAQNALLKIFEEPTEGTHFFLIMPSVETLLPTLRSRLVVIPKIVETFPQAEAGAGLRVSGLTATYPVPEAFLDAHPAERITLLKQLIAAKNKALAIEFLNRLEEALYNRMRTETMKEKNFFILKEISKCRSYLHDRSPSMKMILEYISLAIPITK